MDKKTFMAAIAIFAILFLVVGISVVDTVEANFAPAYYGTPPKISQIILSYNGTYPSNSIVCITFNVTHPAHCNGYGKNIVPNITGFGYGVDYGLEAKFEPTLVVLSFPIYIVDKFLCTSAVKSLSLDGRGLG